MSIETLSTRASFIPPSSRSTESRSTVSVKNRMPKQLVIGLLLVFALLAFELFNFDTTRFALESLLGDVRFISLTWASILAIAFCAIDFAGLAKLFNPSRGSGEPKEVWYLMGAWFLGATMNAVMTWWAVSIVLMDRQFGNEVLSRYAALRTNVRGSLSLANPHSVYWRFVGHWREASPRTSELHQIKIGLTEKKPFASKKSPSFLRVTSWHDAPAYSAAG